MLPAQRQEAFHKNMSSSRVWLGSAQDFRLLLFSLVLRMCMHGLSLLDGYKYRPDVLHVLLAANRTLCSLVFLVIQIYFFYALPISSHTI